MVIKPAYGSVGQVPSPASKPTQLLHKAWQQTEAESALKFTQDGCVDMKHSGAPPMVDMAP